MSTTFFQTLMEAQHTMNRKSKQEIFNNITILESENRTYVTSKLTDKPVEFINDLLEESKNNELQGKNLLVTGFEYNNPVLGKITMYLSKEGENYLNEVMERRKLVDAEYQNLLNKISTIEKDMLSDINAARSPTLQKVEIAAMANYSVDINGNISKRVNSKKENPSRTQLLEDNSHFSEHDAENERFILGDTNSTENTYYKMINDQVVLPSLENIPASMVKDFMKLYK